MRRGMFTILAGVLILLAPAIAQAKSYQGDSERAKSHTASSHRAAKHKSTKHARARRDNSAGESSSRGCLTSEARALLRRIEARFGDVEIVSTCRPGARIATTGKISKHASGEAVDFRIPGRKREVVSWLINNHHSGGTMTYSDMDHIHVDVGYHFVALNRPSGH